MQITPGIYFFNNKIVHSNAKLIKGEKIILIDPGTTSGHNVDCLISELKKINVTRIDEIWLTHVHPDHSQAVPFLKKKFNAKLRTHPIAKPILESPHPAAVFIEQQLDAAKPVLDFLLPGEYKKHKFLLHLMRMIIRFYINFITINWRKTEVDYTFSDGEILYGWQVLYLTGHTPEEVGFYSKDTNILLSGDVIARKRRRKTPVLNTITSDIDKAISTLKIMQLLNPKLIIPGHCGVISEPGKLISQFLTQSETLKSRSLSVFTNTGIQSVCRGRPVRLPVLFTFRRDTMPYVSDVGANCVRPSVGNTYPPSTWWGHACSNSPNRQPVNETTFLTVQRLLRLFYSLWEVHPPSLRFQERLALFFVLLKSALCWNLSFIQSNYTN